MLDPKLLNPAFRTSERAKFLSDNCVKLAEFLETVPDRQHDQGSWVSIGECGTVGCAMGWAVQAGLCEGLKTKPSPWVPGGVYPDVSEDEYTHNRNEWEVAGLHYFGQTALARIFLNTTASRIKTINALYREAERLCDEAKRLKAAEAGGPVRAQIR